MTFRDLAPDNQRCNHGKLLKEDCIVCNKLFEIEDQRNKQADQIKDALTEIQELILQLPGGIDYEADPLDLSPDDMIAHIGGLIYQICEKTGS